MADYFTKDWMLRFKDEWNNEPGISDELGQIKFNSKIAYGFKDDAEPRAVIVVENGKVTEAGDYDGEETNWDLRADPEDWEKWFVNPPGMMTLGIAYTSRKLKFNRGDYAAMVKDPRMAGPFIKSFAVMGRV